MSHPRRMSTVVVVVAGAKLLAHLLTASRYPLHGDELYYVVCGRHLAWSYPDHPPLVPLLAGVTEELAGVAPFWLRFWPALAGAGLVLLTGWMTWRLGGGRLAQLLAALALLVSPLMLMSHTLLQTVFLDQLFWAASGAVLLTILGGADPRRFLLVGLLLGLGVLSKLTIVVWGSGLAVGLLLKPARRLLRTRWPWLAALLVVACAVPVVAWQAIHGWPLLEFMAASRADDPMTPWGFLLAHVGMSGPVVGTLLVAIGFVFFLRSEAGRPWRPLGVAMATVWLVLMIAGMKPYYAGPTYPLLLAGGAVMLERWLVRRRAFWQVAAVALLVAQVWMAPGFLPLQSPEQLAAWQDRHPHDNWRKMFGRQEIVAQIADAYCSLDPAQRTGLRVLAPNYSLAAPVDAYGSALGLPAAISGHNGYAFWETDPTLDPLLVVGYDPAWFRRNYQVVREFEPLRGSPLIRSEEQGEPLFFCQGLTAPAAELWAELRHFD